MSAISPEFETELVKLAEDIDGVVKEALEGSAANDVFTDQLSKSLTFYGKSLACWEDELAVVIPDDKPTNDLIISLYIELANKIQIANHYYVISSTASNVSASGINIKKADLITALVSYYHANGAKLPPNTVLEKMADAYTRKLSNINSISKIVKDFWKEKLNTLREVKSLLSNIGIATATELKYAGGE